MRNVFVETENFIRFQAAMDAMDRRGAEEACLLVVDGRPGLGKTTILYRWAAQTGAVFLRAKKEWSPGWFLNDLLEELRITPKHSYEKRYRQAMQAIEARRDAMEMQKRTFTVVIDEADHFARSEKIMESIRDFSDTAKIPFVLIGMGRIRDNLTAFAQISSRTQPSVRFEVGTLRDARRFFDAICEVSVADDLVAFVHRVTGGYNREIKEAIAVIERFGRRNAHGTPVSLSDMAGQQLLSDRSTGNPVIVPEAL